MEWLVLVLAVFVSALVGYLIALAAQNSRNKIRDEADRVGLTRLTELETKLAAKSEEAASAARDFGLVEHEKQEIKTSLVKLEISNQFLQNTVKDLKHELDAKTLEANAQIEHHRSLHAEAERAIAVLYEQDSIRRDEHNKKIDSLNETYRFIKEERDREAALVLANENQNLTALKLTWSRHQDQVEEKIRLFAQMHGVEYLGQEKFPLGGKPDNTLRICGEFIVLDSKSPRGEDLSNFPTYVRDQAAAAKKYAKNDLVKKDIFFVVPTSAIGVIEETFLQMGDYRVHIVTIEALPSIIAQLRKIEDYEFTLSLSPADRENVSSAIGKMAHGMKRRLQVDQFFADQTLEILAAVEKVPSIFLDKANEVGNSSLVNPPGDKRSKILDTKSLAKEKGILSARIEAEGVNIGSDLVAIEDIPLLKEKPA